MTSTVSLDHREEEIGVQPQRAAPLEHAAKGPSASGGEMVATLMHAGSTLARNAIMEELVRMAASKAKLPNQIGYLNACADIAAFIRAAQHKSDRAKNTKAA